MLSAAQRSRSISQQQAEIGVLSPLPTRGEGEGEVTAEGGVWGLTPLSHWERGWG